MDVFATVPIKNHEINELEYLTEPYNETKDDFVKQIQNFDWKEFDKFPLEKKIKELYLSINIVKKLGREIDSLKNFETDLERNLVNIDFKYKGLFTSIDQQFDKYYSEC